MINAIKSQQLVIPPTMTRIKKIVENSLEKYFTDKNPAMNLGLLAEVIETFRSGIDNLINKEIAEIISKTLAEYQEGKSAIPAKNEIDTLFYLGI